MFRDIVRREDMITRKASELLLGDLCVLATVPPVLGLLVQCSHTGNTGVDMTFLEVNKLVAHRMGPGRVLVVVNSIQP